MTSGTTTRGDDVHDQALADQIAQLLLTRDVQEINFAWGHLTIGPSGFRRVAEALRSGRLRVYAGGATRGLRAIAAYADKGPQAGPDARSVLLFRRAHPLRSPDGRAHAVHECAHAVTALDRAVARTEQEHAAVYVAEAWYRLNVAGCGGVPILKHGVTAASYRVAAALRERSRAAGGTVVSPTAEERVTAVRRHVRRTPEDEGGFLQRGGL